MAILGGLAPREVWQAWSTLLYVVWGKTPAGLRDRAYKMGGGEKPPSCPWLIPVWDSGGASP